jgi:hypothetical protein
MDLEMPPAMLVGVMPPAAGSLSSLSSLPQARPQPEAEPQP